MEPDEVEGGVWHRWRVVMDLIYPAFDWEVNDLEPCWAVKVNDTIKDTVLIWLL